MSLGLCVCGCGQFARTFAKAVRSFKWFAAGDVELFFASRDMGRARAYARRFGGAGAFGSYEEAAADPRVDALYLCTPHHLHMEQTLMAARASKHVLVEKPIARTVDEAERMIAAASEASVKLMVAENYRFMPLLLKSRELITQGAIGRVRFIQVQEEGNYNVVGWRTDLEMMGGGVLIDGGIHSIDMIRDLAGEPEEVYASVLPRKIPDLEGEDGIVLMLRLGGGATGLVNHAWGISKRAWKLWVAISGTEGRIYFEPRGTTLTLETARGTSRLRFPDDRTGIGGMVRELRDSIAEDRPPLTSGEEGLRDLRVVLDAYQSAATGAAVGVG